MLDRNDIEAYRRITAPQTLQDKVMALAEESPKKAKVISIKRVLAAACLAVVITAASASLYAGEITVSLYGNEVSEGTVELVPGKARGAEASGVTVEIEAHSKTELSVSGGTVEVYDRHTGAMIFSGTSGTFKGDVTVSWFVSPNDNERSCEMKVSGFAQEYSLTLDAARGGGSLRIKKM